MKLLVNPIDYQNAIELINLGTHIITVGQNDFSCRNSNNLNIDEIAKLIKQKKQTLIYVLINRFFFEPEISNLQKYLVAISKLKIDAIIFSDYAVAQILHEQKISIKLIYNPETMVRAFAIAGYGEDVVKEKFGGMYAAFQYGAPPHGGCAFGLDRLVQIMLGEPNLREVVAFPTNQRGQDLMLGAPREVTEQQLREVHIQVRKKN
jgi:hypothetical protein